MATTTTTTTTSSETSSQNQNTKYDDNEKKRKRMQSNRESARRSRLRKQKHIDDLTAQIVSLKNANAQIQDNIKTTNEHYVEVESENAVLRVQLFELTQRLNSLNEINHVLSSNNNNNNNNNNVDYDDQGLGSYYVEGHFGNNNNAWNCVNHHPIMASADNMFHC